MTDSTVQAAQAGQVGQVAERCPGHLSLPSRLRGLETVVLAAAGLFLLACEYPWGGDGKGEDPIDPQVRVETDTFGALPDGREVSVYALSDGKGMEVRLMDYGATILSIRTPDRTGRVDDVALGFDDLSPYLLAPRYFGPIVGRYGNRIAGGSFTIEGKSYELARNNGPNHLHGGDRGFDKVLWSAETFQEEGSAGVVLRYVSPDGEEGYPGTLHAQVTYTLTASRELVVDYLATTDAPTHVNLTQHTFFNLAGAGKRDVLDHEVSFNASFYTPVDDTFIPTGEIASVSDTPFDFREGRAIGAGIRAAHPQIQLGGGYNHNLVLDRITPGPMHAAHVWDPESGRTLDLYTTEPGVQFFTGNSLDGSAVGRGGLAYQRYYGFCLETQHFPDSPNQPDFPSTLLRPGEKYSSRTVFAFGVQP